MCDSVHNIITSTTCVRWTHQVQPVSQGQTSCALVLDCVLQVNTSCEEAIDKVECATSDLRADLDRWLVDKDEGMRDLLRDMADEHMQYHEKVTLPLLVLLVQ